MSRRRGGLIRSLRLALVGLGLAGLVVAGSAALASATGHRLVVISSGSMGASMPVGSLDVIDVVAPDQVRSGDVVTVALDSGALITHRVVGRISAGGLDSWVLHGDANPDTATEVVGVNQQVGRVAITVPAAGYVMWWFSLPAGVVSYVILMLLVVLLIGLLKGDEGRPEPHRRGWRGLRESVR